MVHILLLEDDQLCGQLIKQTLLEHRCQVSWATTLDAAYAYLESEHFDLVLTDRILPDGDGVELIAYAHDLHYDLPVICLSQLRELDHRIKGLENG
ncbi:MAG: response regulator, partial [bacterium]|nr:response regulator [bacterium]